MSTEIRKEIQLKIAIGDGMAMVFYASPEGRPRNAQMRSAAPSAALGVLRRDNRELIKLFAALPALRFGDAR